MVNDYDSTLILDQDRHPHPSETETSFCNVSYYPIKVHAIPGKGVGISAKSKIPQGEIIIKNVGKNIEYHSKIDIKISQYFFVDPGTYATNSNETNYVILCGEMLFLNHSDTPNTCVIWEKGDMGVSSAYLIAIQEISKNDEITIKYTDIKDYEKELLIQPSFSS